MALADPNLSVDKTEFGGRFQSVAVVRNRTLAAESILRGGVDWETGHAQRVKEVTMRREAGIELESATKQSSTEPASQDPRAPEP